MEKIYAREQVARVYNFICNDSTAILQYWLKKKSYVYFFEGNEKLNIRCMNFILLEVNNRAGFFEMLNVYFILKCKLKKLKRNSPETACMVCKECGICTLALMFIL